MHSNTMAAVYNERPISVYDNLNVCSSGVHTSTPKSKPPSGGLVYSNGHDTPTTAVANSTVALSKLTRTSTYNDKNKQANVHNRNLNEANTITTLITSPHNLNTITTTIITTTVEAFPALAITKTTTAQTPSELNATSLTSTATILHDGSVITKSTMPTTTATTTTMATINITANNDDALTTLTNAQPLLESRSLSQQSQAELNETGHNIAAVKAALNEAKSKFFGIGINSHIAQQQQRQQQQSYYNDPNDMKNEQFLKNNCEQLVQIKIQPKYQNIPENSAVYRQQQLSSCEARSTVSECSSNLIANMSEITIEKPTPTITYKEILLNDIDGLQQPSQAVYMTTTVPQNIKGSKIAGRHTPTRSSLRHSRMLVVNNKSYQDSQHANPMDFRQPRLARWLVILQVIVASMLLSLAIWQFLLAPNTSMQDNTYWSALVLLCAGILNLNLIRYQLVKRYKGRDHCFSFLRINSHVLSLLALLLCIGALVLASLHYGRLTAFDTKCESSNMLLEQGSCTCTFRHLNEVNYNGANGTVLLANGLFVEDEDPSYKFEYRDLSCPEVSGVWLKILTCSIILNSLGLLVSLNYIVLLLCYRSNATSHYNSVQTNI